MARNTLAPGLRKAMPMSTSYQEMPQATFNFDDFDADIIGLTADDVEREQAKLGRKFEAADVDQFLLEAAISWIKVYESDPSSKVDPFLCDMQKAHYERGTLTPGQAKGVLNCMAARARFTQKAAKSEARDAGAPTKVEAAAPAGESVLASNDIRNGIYTVMLNDTDYVTIKVKDDFRDDAPEGSKVLAYLSGPDNDSSYTGFAFYTNGEVNLWKRYRENGRLQAAALILTLADSPDEFGKAYAMQSGNCWICNRTLTTPESIERGIGPECAKKL